MRVLAELGLICCNFALHSKSSKTRLLNEYNSHPKGLSFVVIGMNDEKSPLFPDEVRRLISEHRIFSGGRRHRELVGELLPEGAVWIDIVVPLSDVYAQYRLYDEPVLVFASGDPLFFGFTTTLMREFEGRVTKTFPSFSSLQMLAHALRLPYHDMRVVSLTGRPWHEFDRALIERAHKVGVLTDRKNTPATIAKRMLDYGYTAYRMYIGVLLGGEREETYSLPLEEVVTKDFAHPNCLIIEAVEPQPYDAPLGLKELDFFPLNRRVNMITKMPIRLVSLSLLELERRRSFWDVGFCTGSVSIEAKLRYPHLTVTAFEVRGEGTELMETNSQRFHAPGIDYHIGDFLAQPLESLPRPEAAFIGGHGGRLPEFVARLAELIGEDGIIVFNSVSEETLQLFRDSIAEIGWTITYETRLAVDSHNPITILQAKGRRD